jgi:hypothetical protein
VHAYGNVSVEIDFLDKALAKAVGKADAFAGNLCLEALREGGREMKALSWFEIKYYCHAVGG